jgi:hypothetical protein
VRNTQIYTREAHIPDNEGPLFPVDVAEVGVGLSDEDCWATMQDCEKNEEEVVDKAGLAWIGEKAWQTDGSGVIRIEERLGCEAHASGPDPADRCEERREECEREGSEE